MKKTKAKKVSSQRGVGQTDEELKKSDCISLRERYLSLVEKEQEILKELEAVRRELDELILSG